MLKHEITYEDFNGDTVTESFYFHLSKPELMELEVEQKQGLSMLIKQIVDSQDNKEMIAIFKKIVLMSYGEKSPDGKRFIKNDELREAFSQTAAYQKLFMDLVTEDNVAANFIKGLMPKDMQSDVERVSKEIETADPTVAPAPAPAPATGQ
jgi:hypothetical protein